MLPAWVWGERRQCQQRQRASGNSNTEAPGACRAAADLDGSQLVGCKDVARAIEGTRCRQPGRRGRWLSGVGGGRQRMRVLHPARARRVAVKARVAVGGVAARGVGQQAAVECWAAEHHFPCLPPGSLPQPLSQQLTNRYHRPAEPAPPLLCLASQPATRHQPPGITSSKHAPGSWASMVMKSCSAFTSLAALVSCRGSHKEPHKASRERWAAVGGHTGATQGVAQGATQGATEGQQGTVWWGWGVIQGPHKDSHKGPHKASRER